MKDKDFKAILQTGKDDEDAIYIMECAAGGNNHRVRSSKAAMHLDQNSEGKIYLI